MNIKASPLSTLKEKLVELEKEFEKNKNRLISIYQKMTELSDEYEKIIIEIDRRNNNDKG